MRRISISGLLGFVAGFAIGLAALVNASPAWAGIAFTLTLGVLLASVLALILRGWRQGGWLGFALFGWGYFLLGNISALGVEANCWLLPDVASEWVFSKSNPEPVPSAEVLAYIPGSRMSPEVSAFSQASNDRGQRAMNATNIGRWLSVLLFAEAGAIVGVFLARGRPEGVASPLPA